MSSIKRSIKIREDFMDRPHQYTERVSWDWPARLQHVGSCEAVMYSSDKWQKDKRKLDYKHRAEAPQKLYVPNGSLKGNFSGRTKTFEFPDTFAFLATCLGVQAKLSDGGFYQLDYPRCRVGAGKFDSGDTFLIVYDKEGVHAVVVGDDLDVLKDGIVG